jgi:hypothetical protein
MATDESPEKGKPDLKDGNNTKLACCGEYDAESMCELVLDRDVRCGVLKRVEIVSEA